MSNVKQIKIGDTLYDLLGHAIINGSGNAMTHRFKLKIGSNLAVSDDSTNQQTVISVDTDNSVTSGSGKPVTSGAVYNVVGDIETLLASI